MSLEKEKLYADELLSRSQGDAIAMVNMASAYKDEKIKSAQGEVSRLSGMLAEFRNAPEVTRQRLYLETMENVLSQAGKVVLGPEEWNMLPFINLPEIEAMLDFPYCGHAQYDIAAMLLNPNADREKIAQLIEGSS